MSALPPITDGWAARRYPLGGSPLRPRLKRGPQGCAFAPINRVETSSRGRTWLAAPSMTEVVYWAIPSAMRLWGFGRRDLAVQRTFVTLSFDNSINFLPPLGPRSRT